MNDEIELRDSDYQVLSTEVSVEREKELLDQGIILNYKIVSNRSDHRSDNEKFLEHYQCQRVRYTFNKVLMPLLIKSANREKTQDISGDAKTKYLILAIRGTQAEEASDRRCLN